MVITVGIITGQVHITGVRVGGGIMVITILSIMAHSVGDSDGMQDGADTGVAIGVTAGEVTTDHVGDITIPDGAGVILITDQTIILIILRHQEILITADRQEIITTDLEAVTIITFPDPEAEILHQEEIRVQAHVLM